MPVLPVVDAGLFSLFSALPGYDAATSGLELSLALCASDAILLLLICNERATASVSGLLHEPFKVAM